MKILFLFLCGFLPASLFSQNLQLHYDFRHSTDPAHNTKNFPTIYFEYFKSQDSGHAFIKPGTFLFKLQADLLGENGNIGKGYMQITQTFRLWQPQVYIHVSYSGGLGVTEPKQYSYYITNTYALGLAYPFQWKGAYLSAVLDYKYVPYQKPSFDFLYTLYFYKGFFHYKFEFAGDFSLWTENKDHGDELTAKLNGKRFFAFAEPQVWYNVNKSFSVGSKINMYYHIYTNDNIFQAYPTVAVKCKF